MLCYVKTMLHHATLDDKSLKQVLRCMALQEKQQAVEEAAQAALEASSAAEAQHAAACKQLALDKRNVQEQQDQVNTCMSQCFYISVCQNDFDITCMHNEPAKKGREGEST